MAELQTDRLTDSVREEAEKQADTARQELGELVLEFTDEYFPEAAMKRRRRDVAGGFVLGAAAGVLVRHLLD